jgi:medium-chain acyl-[acyl-carrier-protein] hydrolase
MFSTAAGFSCSHISGLCITVSIDAAEGGYGVSFERRDSLQLAAKGKRVGKRMKIATRKMVQIGDVAINRRLRLDALVSILQQAAILHTQQVGVSLNSLLDSGRTWVLSRLVVEIGRMPELDEEVEVHTWSRAIQRFKGLRDYQFYIDGEPVASASTLWLYLDTEKRRPVRTPDEYQTLYGVDPTRATVTAIEQWEPPLVIEAEDGLTITTRLADFDVNGHVNNAVVLQYVETATVRVIGMNRAIRSLRLAFQKEIPVAVKDVQVAVHQQGDSCLFQIRNSETLFVSGMIETAAIDP